MTYQDPARIDLGPDEGFPDLLTRIKSTRGDELTVSFDDPSGLLLTAAEFRQMRITADQVRVNIILETNDPLRIQLASMFGFARIARYSEEQQDQIEDHPEWPVPPTRPGSLRSTLPIGTVATSKPWREETVDASAGYSVPPRPIPRPEPAMEPRTGSIQKQEADARARMRPSTAIGIAAFFVALLCVAAVLSIVLRTGKIVVATQRQAVSTTLVIGYSTDGSPVNGATITLPATETDFSVPLITTANATGTLASSGSTARGTVDLRNISGKAVTIPAGTEFAMADGVTYVVMSDVKLAKGDSDKPAKGQVAITAKLPGSSANRDPGVLTGQITAFPGVYFSNLSAPVAGGNDNVTKVIAQQDIDAANSNARASLNSMAKSWTLPDGRIAVPSTVTETGDISVETDHTVGDQVDTFNVSAQGTFHALVIDPNNVPENLRAELRQSLAASVPDGYALTDEPIRFTKPVESTPGSGLLQVDATIDAAAILTQDDVNAVRAAASGKSVADAKRDLAGVTSVSVESVSVEPSLLVKTLPKGSRIKVSTK
jgi:hypothetical protein